MRDRLVRTGVAALAAAPALALGIVLAPPAAAHDTLVDSSPADGASLTEQPDVVELIFDQPVQRDFAQVAVVDAAEATYQVGKPEVVGSTITQDVGELPDGDYTISYRIVSADGHPVTGTLTFSLAAGAGPTEPATTATPTTAATPTTTPTPTTGSTTSSAAPPADESDGGSSWLPAVLAGLAIMAAGGFVLAGRRGRDRDEHRQGDTEQR